MKLTIDKTINYKSNIVKHDIVLQASNLLQGREGALDTEKKMYLQLSAINIVIEEDLFDMIDKDERPLRTIMTEDIDPLLFELMENKDFKDMYEEVEKDLFSYVNRIWNNQHSVIGLIDAILTTLGSLDSKDKKEAIEAVGNLAKEAYDKRTESMNKELKESNDKLSMLVKKYEKMTVKND